jgi:hypothetical protein
MNKSLRRKSPHTSLRRKSPHTSLRHTSRLRRKRIPKRKSYYSYFIDSTHSKFVETTEDILNKSHINKFVDIYRVDNKRKADIIIRLVSREDCIELIKKSKVVSMEDVKDNKFFSWVEYLKPKPEVNIDYEKWLNGSEIDYGISLKNYRKTLIQHEFLHALGYAHVNCNVNTKTGNKCPLMFGPSVTYKKNHIHNHEVSEIDFSERLPRATIKPILKLIH